MVCVTPYLKRLFFFSAILQLSFFDAVAQVPDEIESLGGHALGFGNAGAVAGGSIASVRANPAMLAVEKQYTLHAGYHWPSLGRDFYQVGAVDSKTSPVAAGLSYTAGIDDFSTVELENSAAEDKDKKALQYLLDSPIVRRLSFAVAIPSDKFALGVGADYVEGFPPVAFNEFSGLEKTEPTHGVGLHVGLAGLLTKMVRLGVSAENLNQKLMKNLAPTVYRGSAAVILMGGAVTFHLDLKRRERILQEKEYQLYTAAAEGVEFDQLQSSLSKPEDMVVGSFSLRAYDMLMVLGGYAHEVSEVNPRQSLSGGLALVNNFGSLSYTASKPYFSEERSHHAVNCALHLDL